MWKQLGAVHETSRSLGPKIESIPKPYSPSPMNTGDRLRSPIQNVKENQQAHSFCERYFKSVEKKRLDSSRISNPVKNQFGLSQIMDGQKSRKNQKSEGNDSMIQSENEIALQAKKNSDSPLKLNVLANQGLASRRGYKSSPNKFKDLKKRVEAVKNEYKSTRISIMKQILLFKNQMTNFQAHLLSAGQESKLHDQFKTETTISGVSPAKQVLTPINRQIEKYQRSMEQLEKRKQQLLQLILANEAKMVH